MAIPRSLLLSALIGVCGVLGFGCAHSGITASLSGSASSTPGLTLASYELAPSGGKAKPGAKYAVVPGSSPGQLTILNSDGKESGVCPLQHTDVTADVAGYVARVTVTQEFRNPTTEPIEATYTFPLPDDAAVDDMTMTIGSRKVKGQILRREEAQQVYDAAKAEGKAAALLNQERPNIFTQSVANIMPGDKIVITISYVNLLKYEEGNFEFSFPMVVGPRYTPSGGYTVPGKRGDPSAKPAPTVLRLDGPPQSAAVVNDADRITPPITPPGTRAGHDISMTVNLDVGMELQSIESVLHTVKVDRPTPTRATIKLKNDTDIPNRDFILRYSAAGADVKSGILTYAPDAGQAGSVSHGGYFTLILQPPSAPPAERITPKEMVFVIDQTGSQHGWPIEKAKETMRHCIQHLNRDDTFQLIGFNTSVYPCFGAPVKRTPETVQKALDFLKPLEGSGGTDILKSVDYALKIPDDPDRLRIVCYMTDGYVGDDMQIIDFVKKHRGSARMFPFGVGDSVNRFLIDGMAREGRGAPEYVTLQTPGQDAADRFYRRIASPLLLDISVDWGALPVEDVYPRNIPDVFTSAPIIVKGRYTHSGEGDVTVKGLLRGKPWSQTVHVVFPETNAEGSAIATLWAREKIEDLQSQDYLGAQQGNPNPSVQEQIVATALEYRLMSRFTSFVAVEEKVVNVGGKQRSVDVPVEMAHGVDYGGIFGDGEAGRPQAFGSAAHAMAKTLSASSFQESLAKAAPSKPLGGFANGSFGGGLEDRSKSAAAPDSRPILSGDVTAYAGLAKMKPGQRAALLEQVKLAPGLRGLAEKVKSEGVNGSLDKPGIPKVENGRVEVQIWLNKLPPDALDRLKALGFDLSATLMPGKLVLGTVPVEKLDALLELTFVRHIDPPKFR